MAAGPGALYEVLTAQDELQLIAERVVVYASQRYHQDMGNRHYQEMSGRAQAAAAQVSDAMSFVSPEILSIGKEKLETFFAELPELEKYRRLLEEELRFREHVLSPELETVLAKAQEMADSPQQIFMAFNNASPTLSPSKPFRNPSAKLAPREEPSSIAPSEPPNSVVNTEESP